ncbi:MAG: 16S rRNA (guanine(966)-N(2))-methyltransferase RsmD [Candidatus Eisenbacteria bacterium]|nr:16S rRNA (guanine(966)-N(2))-methyltransferase RsmD [Candidatus Eisenbacteria bacterium]
MRVIAGTLGGRRLRAPRGLATRPTTDRVREAVFMTLEPLAGLRVVDLYAGSGALGIEALSRGAAHADFVEFDRNARRVLEENLTDLGIVQWTTVWSVSLPQGLKRLRTPIERADLVLLDPPYGGSVARETLAGLGNFDLKAMARVVLEHHARDDVPDRCGALVRVREKRYGETRISTYRRGDSSEGPAHKERAS